MNKINEIKLIELLPESIRNNPDIVAAANAVDLGFLSIAEDVENLIIIPNIDQVSDGVLDHLAYFFHVDFYDVNMKIKTKRELIKKSIYIHQVKGTPSAIENLVSTLFGSGEVEEWFEYGGNPYNFKVTVDISALKEGPGKFYIALDTVKNTRSHLEMFIGRLADIMLILNLKTYDFDVPYKICNMFKTDDVKGGLAKTDYILDGKIYEFGVVYPICNNFVATELTLN